MRWLLLTERPGLPPSQHLLPNGCVDLGFGEEKGHLVGDLVETFHTFGEKWGELGEPLESIAGLLCVDEARLRYALDDESGELLGG